MSDIVIDAALLSRAARRNGYAVPTTGLVFFGIRGLSPEHPFDNGFADSHPARFAKVNFRAMRCTLGQWDVDRKQIALFPGSTVPSGAMIASSRAQGGAGTNLLMLGRYEHERGTHKNGKPNGHRAFRQAVFCPVWRTADNSEYDLRDEIDFGSGPGSFVWDNIHCAFYENPEQGYSSAGCQVVCGLPSSQKRRMAPETGPWKTFVENGYRGSQTDFAYLLFSADELATAATGAAGLKQVVRYGSSGPLAKEVQAALIGQGLLQGEADSEFGRLSLMALVKFQRQKFGPAVADGVCGENTAAALGIRLPSLSAAPTAPLPVYNVKVSTGGNAELDDETDLPPDMLNFLLAALGMPVRAPAGDAVVPVSAAAAPVATPASAAVVAAATATATVAVNPGQSNFERAQEIIREFEGGYVDHPKDPGGATNFGITKRTLEVWRGRSVSKAEVKAMSYDEAKKIYFAEYWSKSSCDSMPGPLALVIYNVAVHAGPGRAGKFLQTALNENGARLKIDGDIAKDTLGAIPDAPLDELISDVIDLYEQKLRAHKDFATFKTGFLRRVNKLRLETDRWLAEEGATAAPVSTPKIEDGDEVMAPQANDIIAELLRRLQQPATPSIPIPPPIVTPPIVTPPVVAPAENSLVMLLRQIADQLDPAHTSFKPNSTQTTTLTPVNSALGQTVGKLLDGRKSALGIFGALASALFMPGEAATGGASAIGSVLGTLGGVTGAASSVAPVLMPVSLALTAWGLLGKLDKYARSK